MAVAKRKKKPLIAYFQIWGEDFKYRAVIGGRLYVGTLEQIRGLGDANGYPKTITKLGKPPKPRRKVAEQHCDAVATFVEGTSNGQA